MNIFKVMASGKRKFSEECSSALLAWLMSPQMEHGLGNVFLYRFVQAAVRSCAASRWSSLLTSIESIEPVLRTQQDLKRADIEMHLEMNVSNHFIDVVCGIGNCWLAIENKIYDTSVNTEKDQLRLQYEGLRKWLDTREKGEDDRKPDSILSVYLVPSITPHVSDEFKRLQIPNGEDAKVVMTWAPSDPAMSEIPVAETSVCDILRGILKDERDAKIAPLSDYARQTFKSLLIFIEQGFGGYVYERPAGSAGLNPHTKDLLTLKELRDCLESRDSAPQFAGIAQAEAGLMRMSEKDIRTRKFQYTTVDMDGQRNWLPLGRFLEVALWRVGEGKPPSFAHGNFRGAELYELAKALKDSIYIGVGGGRDKLREICKHDPEDLKTKLRGISDQKRSSNWIPGTEFVQIVEEAGVFRDG